MFLLTEPLSSALLYRRIFHNGLCFWSEPHTGRTFFYCACDDAIDNPAKPPFIFRFDICEPSPKWHFIGQLDFFCVDADVSPCGRYFWSMEVFPQYQQTVPVQLIFRQINPNNLKYTKFTVTPAGKNTFICPSQHFLYRIGSQCCQVH